MPNKITESITFKLGDELFSINVAQVREVLEVGQITKIPSTPEYMRGVCNVRGHAIPILDLRMRLGLPSQADTVVTRVIVMELDIEGESVVVGGVADSVHEVIEIEPASIHPAPTIAMRWRADFIEGMVGRGDEFIIMLNVNAVFSSEEIALVEEATERSSAA
jgi:purine-binding chemotaxis protein CheW